MKTKIKNYLVLTSPIYRLAVFLLMPIVTIGVYRLLQDATMALGLVMVMALLLMAEIFFDTWLFGGIQSKDAEKLDYLKTSPRGMQMMRDALCLDIVRRFLSTVAIFGICYLIGGEAVLSVGPTILIYHALVTYTISVLGVFIARFECNMWINMVIGYVGLIVAVLSLSMAGLFGYVLVWVISYAVLAVLVSILAVKVAVKKVEGSYYDK